MTCYFRHLKDILEEADFEVTPQNRKQIDLAIHDFVGLTHEEDCPVVWKRLKQDVLPDEEKRRKLAEKLKNL